MSPKANGKSKGGRPSTYSPELHNPLCFELFSEGKTMAEVAKDLGINLATLYEWQKTFPGLADAIKRAKESVDAKVEASLFKRACGYQQPDTHIGAWQGQAIVTPVIKHIAPDPTSMIFWLKNRQPKKWRDKIDHDLTPEAADTLGALIQSIRSTSK
jgi:hypothetical protein